MLCNNQLSLVYLTEKDRDVVAIKFGHRLIAAIDSTEVCVYLHSLLKRRKKPVPFKKFSCCLISEEHLDLSDCKWTKVYDLPGYYLSGTIDQP